jgi:hypothetical protein
MRLLAMLALCLFVVVAYGRTVSFGFVYDDHWTVVHNPKLDEPLSSLLKTLLAGRGTHEAIPDATRPAMVASLWLDRRLFGTRAGGYHAHSVLLYALCCVLAAALALALSRRRHVATFAAIFFAGVPVHAEPVSAVNYREDLIAAAGVLAALLCLCRRGGRGSPLWIVAPAACWTVALMAKESAIVLVPLLLLLWILRRPSDTWLRKQHDALLGLGAVLILWGTWRIALRGMGDDIPMAASRDGWTTLLATARFEVRAVVSSLLPFTWSPEYAEEGVASPLWVLALLAIAIGALGLALRRRTRIAALGVCWSLVAALPMSPLVGPVNARADRYLFLSVLGGALVWGVLADEAARWVPPLVRHVALAAAAIFLFVLAWPAISIWRSDFTVWTAATDRAPTSARAWTGLSRALRLNGELDSADAAIERALELQPNFPYARVTKIYNRLARGDVETARLDLALVEELDLQHPGLARAKRCAALPSREAARCIRQD